jgi:hypothetical protein
MPSPDPATIDPHRLMRSGAAFPDPVLCAEVAAVELGAMAGDHLRLVSLTVEMGAEEALGEGAMETDRLVDRQSRSIAFLRLIARSNGRLVFQARAVFAVSRA